MTDEYIRLDTTIIAIDNLINETATGTMARTLFKAKDTIYKQQRYVIDKQPIRHGRWDFQGYQLFKCTNCKEMFTQDQLEAMQNHKDCEECTFPNFCPYCGAKMIKDGEQK